MTTHPVWAVYDKLRSARLNEKYCGARLSFWVRLNFFIEIVTFTTTPSSIIARSWLFETEYGQLAWKVLGLTAAVFAVVRPILNPTKIIKEYEGMLHGYRTIHFDLMEIKSSIEHRKKYDSTLRKEYSRIIQREKALLVKTPETSERTRLKLRCEKEVLAEHPVESFFVPTE